MANLNFARFLIGSQSADGLAAVPAPITIPTTIIGGTAYLMPQENVVDYLGLQGVFVYGSGGTSCKAYLQTSFDNGNTWCDVVSMAFATATATKVAAIQAFGANITPVAPTDGTLADNTIAGSLFGDRVRVKVIVTGTYAATSLQVSIVCR